MEEPRFKIPVTAVVLPAALLLSSAIFLFLTVQGANLATLRSENEKEAARQSELSASLKTVRDQIDPARRELSALTAEQAKIAEDRKAALETIARAGALAQTVEQIRRDEASATKRLDDLRKAQGEATDKVEAARNGLATLDRKLEQARADKAEADTKLSDTVAREVAAVQKLAERERTILAREKVLAERDRALSERDAELAAATVAVKRLEAQKRTLETEISEKRTEAKSASDQLARVDGEKVAAADLQRLQAEKAELVAKVDQLRQELRFNDASLREKEDLKKRLELSIAELTVRKNSAEAAAKK